MTPTNLLIFGNGYSGGAIASLAIQHGIPTTITSRSPSAQPRIIPFAQAEGAIAAATHIIATAAPDDQGDPILTRYTGAIAAAPQLQYIGYLSTTGVYGNRDGAWVDEDTTPTPQSTRAQRRLAAEIAWSQLAENKILDIFRLAGIYGPGRSMFDDLRDGTARRVVKPGHLFGRIHIEDIALGVLTAMLRKPEAGTSIFNFSDDEPAASADVVVEAARLLGVSPPEPVPFEQARLKMSPLGRSFWAENRRVSNAKTKAALNLTWRYPTYREGLAAILCKETKSA
jgi:nucleoside-diphosphate-sugar epimerase